MYCALIGELLQIISILIYIGRSTLYVLTIPRTFSGFPTVSITLKL